MRVPIPTTPPPSTHTTAFITDIPHHRAAHAPVGEPPLEHHCHRLNLYGPLPFSQSHTLFGHKLATDCKDRLFQPFLQRGVAMGPNSGQQHKRECDSQWLPGAFPQSQSQWACSSSFSAHLPSHVRGAETVLGPEVKAMEERHKKDL